MKLLLRYKVKEMAVVVRHFYLTNYILIVQCNWFIFFDACDLFWHIALIFYVAYLFLAQEISDFCVKCDFMRQNLLHMTHHAHYNKGNLRHASYLNINMTYGAYYNKRPQRRHFAHYPMARDSKSRFM